MLSLLTSGGTYRGAGVCSAIRLAICSTGACGIKDDVELLGAEGYGETLPAGMEEGGVGSLVEIESADSTCEYFDVGNLSRAFFRMFKLLAGPCSHSYL